MSKNLVRPSLKKASLSAILVGLLFVGCNGAYDPSKATDVTEYVSPNTSRQCVVLKNNYNSKLNGIFCLAELK